jgi:hypothetical protein
MRDALLVLALSTALVASGCAERAAPARSVVEVKEAGAAPAPRAHLVLAEATPAPAASKSAPPASIEGESSGTARGLGWFSVGLGTLGAGVALTTSVMMLHQKSVRDSGCNAAKVCTEAGLTANDQISSLSGWNAGAYAVALVGIGVGAFLLITNPADSEKQTAIGVAPTGSGAGLQLRSTF